MDKGDANIGVGEAGGVSKFADGPGELDEALRDFSLCVHEWSGVEYSRPRPVAASARQRSWRLAAGWALGLALVAGGVSGGVYDRHHRQELARVAAARMAEQQRLAAQAQARQEEEDLLAKVDSDVSREVPSAMEPLAQLMAGDETR
ncbi:MAG: hypothetical protein ABSD44_01905 [Terracidiphilus sp.]